MSAAKIDIAVFISGRGSNMEALIEACSAPDFPARIAVVFSNDPDAPGLEKARAAGLQTAAINHKNYDSRETFEDAIIETLAPFDPQLICLAGFMRLLTPHFINHYENRILNIHPSLLPDYKGLHTHERVLADGKDQSGCTVHYATAKMDEGEIITSRAVPVLADDTPATLAARILQQEHIAYPQALKIAAEKILHNS